MLLHFKSILFLIKKTYIIGALFILCGCQHSIESLITAIDSFSKANMLVLIGDPNLEYDTRRKLFYDNTLFSGKFVSQTKKGVVLYKKECRNGLLDGKSFVDENIVLRLYLSIEKYHFCSVCCSKIKT